MTQRWLTRAGSLCLAERSSVLPIVGIDVSVRTGALHDPKGMEGLSRLMTRAMRMGTAKLRSRALEERLDELGAQLSTSCAQSYMHFGGVVVAHNLEPFVELLASLIAEPAFRPADVRQVRREMSADLVAMCDEDRTLCARNFRRYAFGTHPYARPRSGTRASLARVEPRDVVAHHDRHVTARNLVIGVWGDFAPRTLPRLLDRCFSGLPRAAPARLPLPEPTQAKGRRLLIVDKPERTQTQIAIGTLGTSAHDRDHVALNVGNTVFGGLFSSRLNHEVRSKRGLSYGASSGLTLSRTRDLWSMHTFPSAKDARACIELQLALYERWVERGISARELAATRRYLVKSHAFEVDTAGKRLDQHVDVELMDWPKTHHSRFVERVKATGVQQVNAALARRLSLRDLTIVLVATASDLLPELERIAGIDTIEVVPFDDI